MKSPSLAIDGTVDHIHMYTVRQSMEKAGFTRVAVTLSVAALLKKELITTVEATDFNGDPYTAYRIMTGGIEWLVANQDRLVLRRDPF
jgi:hypothetical protein